MTEISKMFENAGIKPLCQIPDNSCGVQNIYEDFTVEKQLQLENFLLEDSEDKTFTQFEMLKTIENKFLYVYRFSDKNSNLKRFDAIGKTRQESLARLINSLWQSLNDQEKEEIRSILNA